METETVSSSESQCYPLKSEAIKYLQHLPSHENSITQNWYHRGVNLDIYALASAYLRFYAIYYSET